MRISDWSSDVCSSDLALFLLLLSALWVAGGASHADVTGQVVTRGAAWSLLILAILLSARPVIAGADAAFWLLLATVLLVLLQLVPLPPAIWTALPGRAVLLGELGRAACRVRVGQYGSNSVVAVSLKKKRIQNKHNN